MPRAVAKGGGGSWGAKVRKTHTAGRCLAKARAEIASSAGGEVPAGLSAGVLKRKKTEGERLKNAVMDDLDDLTASRQSQAEPSFLPPFTMPARPIVWHQKLSSAAPPPEFDIFWDAFEGELPKLAAMLSEKVAGGIDPVTGMIGLSLGGLGLSAALLGRDTAERAVAPESTGGEMRPGGPHGAWTAMGLKPIKLDNYDVRNQMSASRDSLADYVQPNGP
jgi:hypothetical protein